MVAAIGALERGQVSPAITLEDDRGGIAKPDQKQIQNQPAGAPVAALNAPVAVLNVRLMANQLHRTNTWLSVPAAQTTWDLQTDGGAKALDDVHGVGPQQPLVSVELDLTRLQGVAARAGIGRLAVALTDLHECAAQLGNGIR